MEETEDTKQVSPEMEKMAAQRAEDRSRVARWDLNIAIFLFAVLILIIILVTYTKMGIEVIAPVAIFGLAMVWLAGWTQGRQLYRRFYDEEIARIKKESQKVDKGMVEEAIEETVEEKVQKALRDRWK